MVSDFRDQVWHQVRSQIFGQVWDDSVSAKCRNQISEHIHEAVRNPTWLMLGVHIANQVKADQIL